MEINERITKIIEYSKLLPAEFAEEVGIQRSSISHIISGRNKPSLDFITKIKTTFPEIEWEWLIRGRGEMIVSKEEEKKNSDKNQKSPIPDLFSFLGDENFIATESDDKVQKKIQRESVISSQQSVKNNLNDSQPLDKKSKNIHRIVFFYTDGSFDTYEN